MNPFTMKATVKEHADSVVDAAKQQLGGILLVVGVIWGVYLIDFVLPFVNFNDYLALVPRKASGLIGVLTMPLVHGGFRHLLSNTIPLIIMLLAIAILRPKRWMLIVGLITLLSGALTWLLASTNVVGASALVLGLMTYLLAPGGFYLAWIGLNRFVRKESRPYPFKIRMVPMIVSGVVGFFFLSSLISNLIPGLPGVSWTAHFSGAVAGVIVAFWFANSGETAESIGKQDASPLFT